MLALLARRRRAGAPLALAAFLAASCERPPDPAPESREAPPPPEGSPRLVLLVIVDQLRADYLERFRPLLTAGFDRLLRESVVFTDARHGHAWTKTAPGHATLVTGTHPSRHGVVSNDWYDRERGVLMESDEDPRWRDDRSPYRLLAPTLGDRLKERWPRSRVFGASGKSRGAVLPAGLLADRAFWLDDETGRFWTSTYYGESPPEWLEDFHRDAYVDRFFGAAWEPLPETTAAVDEYGIETLDRGLVWTPLPRSIGRASVHPDEDYYEDFYWTPFHDRYVLELAQRLIVEEELGADPYPDVLALSFSALDLVGHAWGPDSPEMLDTLLRLDRVLGELLDFVDEHVGLGSTIVTLSADHGVVPVPEVARARGHEGHRFGLEENVCMQAVPERLDEELGEADWFLDDFVIDPAAAEALDVTVAEVESAARRIIEACPGVERVWTATELSAPAGVSENDEMARLHRNNFHPVRSPNLMVQFEPWTVARSGSTTTHGSPYDYDTRVPWLLRLPSGAGRAVDTPVLTVDVAPTLAALLGISMGDEIDGRNRLTDS